MELLGFIFSWLLWFAAAYIVVAVGFRFLALRNFGDGAWGMAFRWPQLLFWFFTGSM